jgi:hypothetical protein
LKLLRREHAIAEIYGLFLIALLISAVVILILSVSTGFVVSLLQKPPAFAVQARVTTPDLDKTVISLYHMDGEPVALSTLFVPGTAPDVFLTLESPDHKKIMVHPSPVMTGNPWARGGTATIYYDGSHFLVTDDIVTLLAKNGSMSLRNIPSGVWIVYITDQKTQVIVNSVTVTV